ncbi:MAG: bifunctional phosphoglucose/phosphomannose isomerase, partial [Candidatus Bipolaricaulota bacterium]|nr:bifunctional phosphoglucose/phosphomannose isomerase [Candidatus Bipolaricaulota bacterium]
EAMDKLNQEKIPKEYDTQGMIRVLDRFPSQCEEAIELSKNWDPPPIEGVDRVIICGMGGSAMAGEIARRFARIPVFVNRGYTLPGFVDRHSLLVAVSYSGNTAETLSCLNQGIKRDIPAACITSGGEAERIAAKNDISLLRIPSGYQPRAAMGWLALPLLSLFENIDVLNDLGGWEALIDGLNKVRTGCTWDMPDDDNPAKQLAQTLFDKIPCIYGTVDNTDLVAMRWKTQINENAKQPAFWNVFPELNHNEILAMEHPSLMRTHSIVMLKNNFDSAENRARMEIMQGLFAERAIPVTQTMADGATELAQILSQIYLGDYVSLYLALLNGVDPTPVRLIEQFKRELAVRTENSTGV